jgi:histidinol dehydrogenase
MERIEYPKRASWDALCERPLQDPSELFGKMREIVDAVRARKDAAVREYTSRFDKAEISSLEVSKEALGSAESEIPPALSAAIRAAAHNIRVFHESQRVEERAVEPVRGVVCWRESVAIEKVGLYVPGGSAPLFSTLLMLAVPARVAGCKEVIVCTPPDSGGNVAAATRYAAKAAGVERLFRIGGAQAIAALAYGTESVPKVDKILGPGNQYVQAAKQLVYLSGVGIDLPAGPSEVLIVADESADAQFVAADLLAQAEHGPDSQVVLVSLSPAFSAAVEKELAAQLETLPRREIARKALAGSRHIVLKTVEEALAFSNRYAPEHLILSVRDLDRAAALVVSAGSVFVGPLSSESAGDYASGTNHTLPTAGFARSSGGVSLDSFVKKITFQQLSAGGVENLAPVVEAMAEAEGLEGHRRAMSYRRQKNTEERES